RREHRLERHLRAALDGRMAPVSQWIRGLHAEDLLPEILVLERISADCDWRARERGTIEKWQTWPSSHLPVVIPPQTPKSSPTEIRAVALLNVQSLPGQASGAAGDV